jgi:hypothetical protein
MSSARTTQTRGALSLTCGVEVNILANAERIWRLLTDAKDFSRWNSTVAGIEANLPNAFIANDDLRAGRWRNAIDAVLEQPRRSVDIRLDGAAVAAAALDR